jgi:hypothetical protein
VVQNHRPFRAQRRMAAEMRFLFGWYNGQVILNDNHMDKETKGFIENSFEKWTGVILREFERMNGRIDKMEEGLKTELADVREELREVGDTVKRIDYRTQNQVEALYDEVREVQREIDEIRAHVGMPPRRLAA